MSDYDSVGSSGSGEGTSVTDLLFDVADQGSFRDLVDWEDVSDGQLGYNITSLSLLYNRITLGSAIHVLAGVHSFGGDEVVGVLFIFVRVSEGDFN